MPRLLHTADWQLGLTIRGLTGRSSARARDARFRTVERIAALAREEAVDLVVVAGDVFDDNHPSPWVLQRAAEALSAFAPLPVVLLPGNHDPAEPGGILQRLSALPGLAHVHVAVTATPIDLGGVVVHPCPQRQRHETDDPTRHVPARAASDVRVHVVLAHGSARGCAVSGETPNRVDVAAVLARGVDYLALGDWHGLHQVHARAWYPGTPEATGSSEEGSGRVLIVDLAHGSLPAVRPVPVANTAWITHAAHLQVEPDLDALERFFDALDPPSDTLVTLSLGGDLRPAQRARLEALLHRQTGRLLHLDLRQDAVQVRPDDRDLDAIDLGGFIGDALAELRSRQDEAGRLALVELWALLPGRGR